MIVILDFGSQYTQLIARRIRELGVYAEIFPYNIDEKGLHSHLGEEIIEGIILSGGPSSVVDPGAPTISLDFLAKYGVPILGICYGMQLLCKVMGGKLEKSKYREYGYTELEILSDSILFHDIPKNIVVWMSHGDSVVELPSKFKPIAITKNNIIASVQSDDGKFFCVQFHPEVFHTQYGTEIISNFVFKVCNAKKSWSVEKFMEDERRKIVNFVGDRNVVMAVSGGVDSTVMAVYLNIVLGKRLKPVFVNTGLLRMNETDEVINNFRSLGIEVEYIDAEEEFLSALKGVKDPEDKRKIIGKKFIEVFIKNVGNIDILAQGTLYPDVIETSSVKGPSSTIKTHHNRVKEIRQLEKEGRILEPFKFLFKDEVRKLGKVLGIPDNILNRHPFPGPGLAVRIIGEVTRERLDILRKADKIFIDELKRENLYDKVWQSFVVLLSDKAVGVMGDERSYGFVVALRSVNSVDGMTADWSKLPYEFLNKVANRIVREVNEITRVVYDITSKPPATIEWE
ncbi:MAG: glutamine-hydrolyzing GMP synthase [Brevinematales bacterium]|nr:glutamine-hydrolyzing GMP synthase [Brevinematales bacterium]